MTGIVIGPDDRPYRLAQPVQSERVIDQLTAVQLEADLPYAHFLREVRKFAPIGNELLVPLMIEDRHAFRRPGRRDPVWIRISGTSRQSRHHDDPIDTQKPCQPEGFQRDFALALAL